MAIHGPREAHGVTTPEQYEQRQRQALAARSRVAFESQRSLSAYVSHGRWVADCECYNGVSVSVAWGIGRCFECGAVSRVSDGTLVLPGRLAEIEALLEARPNLRNRNWLLTETVEDLQRENDAHLVEGTR